MSRPAWIRKLFVRKSVAPAPTRPARLGVEALEDRAVPATITVTSAADVALGTSHTGVTLRDAIQAANTDTSVNGSAAGSGADTIVFDPNLFATGPATISLTQFSQGLNGDEFGPSAFRISSDVTIVGPTGNNGLTVQRDATAANFRLFYVYGGAGSASAASLTLQNLTLSGGVAHGGNSAAGGAGAGMGGAVFNRQGTLILRNTLLANNTAQGGSTRTASFPAGGAGVGGDTSSNYGSGPNGGGFFTSAGFGGGGAINGPYTAPPGGFGGGGGANYDFGGGGTGGFGGGGGGSTNATSGGGSVFGGGNGATGTYLGGGGAGMGGAIFNESGAVSIISSTLTGNSAIGGTGANNGQGLGGAVFTRNGTVTVAQSTLAGNTANQGGGAVFAAADAGGGSGYSGGNVNAALINSILADTTGSATDFASAVLGGASRAFSGTNNLIEANAGGGNGFTGGIASSADPLLGPLANNGGPTQTLALTPGSPAVDAGSNVQIPVGVSTDQRGFGRTVNGAVDIGAVEMQPVEITVSPSPSVYGQGVAFTATATNLGVAVAGGTVTFLDGGTALSGPLAVGSGGRASFTTAALSAGPHTITAQYSGSLTLPAASLGQAVRPRAITVTATPGQSKVYGTSDPGLTFAVGGNGLAGGDTVASVFSGSLHRAGGRNVGAYAIDQGSLQANSNYAITVFTGANFTVTPRALTVTASGTDKVYDGTAAAAVTLTDDRVAGDDLTTSYISATFGDKTVGTAKPVSVSGISIAGADAGNYSLQNTSAGATAGITPRSLTITASGTNKVYDGLGSATVTLSDDRVSGDDLTTSYTSATFGDKAVGTAKPVTVSGISLTGADAGNYTFDTTASTTAAITARHVAGGFTAQSRVYDGTQAAAVLSRSLTTAVAGDDVSLSGGTATFADKNVGTAKPVTLAGAGLTGADAGNYVLDSVATTTATISARALTVTVAAADKVYDGTTAAAVTLSDDRVTDDQLTLGYAAANFVSYNVGTNRAVQVVGIAVAGPDAGNYTLHASGLASATITPRAITVAAAPQTKIYDGTSLSSATPVATWAGAGPALTAGDTPLFTQAFDDRSAGARTLTPSGTVGDRNGGRNYTITFVTAAGSITPLGVSGSFTAAEKVYDGTPAATVLTRTLAGVVGQDDVSLSGGTATFADKNVGTAKPVTLAGAGLTGADAGNYVLDSVATTTATISARALTIAAVTDLKEYDGSTTSIAPPTVNGLQGADSVTGLAQAFVSPNVLGTGASTLTVTGYTINDGTGGNNYVVSVPTAAGTITPKALTGAITADDRAYDGTTAAAVHAVPVSGVVGTDDVLLIVGPGTFDGKDAGPRTATAGVSLTGSAAGNYALTSSTAAAAATIRKVHLTVTADDKQTVFGGAIPPLTATITGFIPTEALATSGVTGAAALGTTATAGSPVATYPITVGVGTLAAVNYDFPTLVAGTLTIGKASTTVGLGLSASSPLRGTDGLTLTATVAPVAPGAGSPSGTVTFTAGTVALGSAAVGANGVATLTLSAGQLATLLAAGSYRVTASYAGDGSFTPAASPAAPLTVIAPASAQGVVYVDFNDDGQVDFSEGGVSGVKVTLTGTDDLGHAVSRIAYTDNGVYSFANLRPSNAAGYAITETQPGNLLDGRDTLGTIGGVYVGTAGNDVFTGVKLAAGAAAENYNFGERPATTGLNFTGQAAGIGFWQNKKGQELILALNGGGTAGTATQLGNWLAATFPNLYGSLAGKTNAQVAAYYKGLFALNGGTAPAGAPKADAQVMATALSVYVTSATLAGTTAAAYGFRVTTYGLGADGLTLGGNCSAFGLSGTVSVSVLDLLLAVNARSKNGLMFDANGNGRIDAAEALGRTVVNDVFSVINSLGGI